MTEKESAALLKQCDTGLKMGMEALACAAEKIKDPAFLTIVNESYDEHKRLMEDVDRLEDRMGIEKPPVNPIVSGLSKVKSNVLFAMNKNDSTVAKIMSDGTYMGINVLNKKLNRNPFADTSVKDIAQEIVDVEDDFLIKIRPYL